MCEHNSSYTVLKCAGIWVALSEGIFLTDQICFKNFRGDSSCMFFLYIPFRHNVLGNYSIFKRVLNCKWHDELEEECQLNIYWVPTLLGAVLSPLYLLTYLIFTILRGRDCVISVALLKRELKYRKVNNLLQLEVGRKSYSVLKPRAKVRHAALKI